MKMMRLLPVVDPSCAFGSSHSSPLLRIVRNLVECGPDTRSVLSAFAYGTTLFQYYSQLFVS